VRSAESRVLSLTPTRSDRSFVCERAVENLAAAVARFRSLGVLWEADNKVESLFSKVVITLRPRIDRAFTEGLDA
jgi:hypothetical protein